MISFQMFHTVLVREVQLQPLKIRIISPAPKCAKNDLYFQGSHGTRNSSSETLVHTCMTEENSSYSMRSDKSHE